MIVTCCAITKPVSGRWDRWLRITLVKQQAHLLGREPEDWTRTAKTTAHLVDTRKETALRCHDFWSTEPIHSPVIDHTSGAITHSARRLAGEVHDISAFNGSKPASALCIDLSFLLQGMPIHAQLVS